MILYLVYVQGVLEKIFLLSGFEFLTLGGVFLGVKNDEGSWIFMTLSASKGQKSFEKSKYLIFICIFA